MGLRYREFGFICKYKRDRRTILEIMIYSMNKVLLLLLLIVKYLLIKIKRLDYWKVLGFCYEIVI